MPDIGYPDFQRVVNWDSPVLYADSVLNETTYAQSGALDVSRYGYMGGYLEVSVGYCTVTLEWFLDQAMTTIVGQREFVLDQHVANICQPKMQHMGPFLQVTVEAIANAPFTASWSLFATNRASSLDFVPVDALLIDEFTTSLNAGASYRLYAGDYYAGPASMWFQAPAAQWAIYYNMLDVTGAQEIVNLFNPAQGNNNINFVTIPGYWYIDVVNGSGSVGSFYITVHPSLTGST